MPSQSHRIYVADSSSSKHLSQVESSVNPSLKRYPFRWQCPVNSHTTHLNWFLFNFNRSSILLAEDPGISPFACLCPEVDSQRSPWPLVRNSNWDAANWIRFYEWMFRSYSCQLICLFITNNTWPGTHISWTLLCLASSMRDWWQSQTSSEVIWWLPSGLIAAWLSDMCKIQMLLFL
jgi:hypothetical protein